MNDVTSLLSLLDKYGWPMVLLGLMMLGYIVPKWVVDEYRKRESVKDNLIERQTDALEKLAAEVRSRGR